MLRAIVLLGVFLPKFLLAQNLVPNPSFECGSDQCDCTTDRHLVEFLNIACYWDLPTHGTSDFFSTLIPNKFCWSSMPSVGGEYNPPYIGSEMPRTGSRFAGLFTYGKYADQDYKIDTAYREYLQVELSGPLIPGEYYCGEMYVSLAEQPRYASNNIGMYLYDEKIDLPVWTPLVKNPQVVEKNIIRNTNGWTKIYGSFKATSPHKYLAVGNFLRNDETLIINKGGTHPEASSYNHAYYFIDDISLVKINTGPFASASNPTVCKGSGTLLKTNERLENIVWTTLVDTTTVVGSGSSLNVYPEVTTSYRVTANNCKMRLTDTITVEVNPTPQISLGKDTTICIGDSLRLAVEPVYVSYLWQDNSHTNQFMVKEAGTYSVVVENKYGCKTRASVKVNLRPIPQVKLGRDTLICHGDYFALNAGSGEKYKWSTGSTDSVYTPDTSGKFWVRVENQCGEDSDTITIHSLDDLFIPNVLTLNAEDTLNRYFIIRGSGSDALWKLILYNRWGQQIYTDNNYKNDWPADPEKVPSETYYYMLAYPNCPSRKGWVKVIK